MLSAIMLNSDIKILLILFVHLVELQNFLITLCRQYCSQFCSYTILHMQYNRPLWQQLLVLEYSRLDQALAQR